MKEPNNRSVKIWIAFLTFGALLVSVNVIALAAPGITEDTVNRIVIKLVDLIYIACIGLVGYGTGYVHGTGLR